MRNLKKLFAVIVAICIIFTFAVPAFAAEAKYSKEAATLNTLHLYDGISTSTFVPDLGTAVDRQTSIALLVKVLGKKDAALAMAAADVDAALATFTDAKDVAIWAKPYMAYAIKNGLTNGTSATTLSPKAAVTGNMFATFILRNLGYTVDNFNYGLATLQAKGGLTPVQTSEFNKNLIKDDIVGIAYGALQAVDATNKKLVENLIAAKVFTQEEAVKAGVYTISAFAVKSVESTNLKEIVITYTQDANMESDSTATNWATSALNKANYNPAGTVEKIDSKTVLLTITATPASGAAVSVTVKDVTDAAIANTIPTFAKAYLAADTAAPTVSASVDVNKTMTLTFSEPMATTGNVYVGGTLTTFALAANSKTATASLGAAYEAGKTYSVVIVGAKDLNNNYITPNPVTLNVTMVNDTIKPVAVSVTPTANATQLNVKFTEALQDVDATAAFNYATLTFKDPAGNVIGLPVACTAVVADTDSLVYSAAINLLGSYTYRYVDVTVSAYKDYAGNAGDSFTTRILLQKDTTAPVFSSAKATSDNKYIVVNFDEAIALGSAAANGITVEYTNNDGIVYTAETLSVVSLTDKDGAVATAPTAVKLAPVSWVNDDGTLKAGIYTITVKANAIEDAYGNETAAAIVAPVTVGTVSTSNDTTAPTLSSAAFIAGSTKVIEITSNEDLATPVLSNIKLDGAALPTGSKAYLFNNKKTVRIELPADSITLTGYRVLSYTLSDLAGNASTKSVAINFLENVRPVVAASVLADPTKIVLTVSESVTETLAGAAADDFEVYVNGVKATLAASPVTVNGATVTITLNAPVALADTLTVKVVGSDLVDSNKNVIVSGGTFTVTR